jgi:hypothetical protein
MFATAAQMPVTFPHTVPGRRQTKPTEKVLARLRNDLADLFPDLTAQEVEGVLARVLMFARQEKGLGDMPKGKKSD